MFACLAKLSNIHTDILEQRKYTLDQVLNRWKVLLGLDSDLGAATLLLFEICDQTKNQTRNLF